MTISRYCKTCGAKVIIDDSKDKFFCSFCGEENIVDKILDKANPNSANQPFLPPKSNNETNNQRPVYNSFQPTMSAPSFETRTQNNIHFSYKTSNNNVRMHISIPSTGMHYDFENNDIIELCIPEGHQVVFFQIGKISYSRDIFVQNGVLIHLFCSWNGHAEINTDLPNFVNQSNYVQTISPRNQSAGTSRGRTVGKVFAIIAIVVATYAFFSAISSFTGEAKKAQIASGKSIEALIGDKTTFTDLGLGDVGKSGDIYVGLQYVKSSSTLHAYLTDVNAHSDKSIILAFFEFYNGSNKTLDVNPSSINCYVDGTKANGLITLFIPSADGVKQYSTETLDPGCQLLSVQDFEVPKEWKEIKFYYESDCVWTISKGDVSEKEYHYTRLISAGNSITETNVDDIIFSDNYEVQYKGVDIVYNKDVFSGEEESFVMFKFHITNTGNERIKTSTFGSKRRCYQNNFFLGEESHALPIRVDGYKDFKNVSHIDIGMSEDVYIAFKTLDNKQTGNYYFVFDGDDSKSSEHGAAYVVVK